MGKLSNVISQAHAEFISKQKTFFVATAPLNISGRINISPKGLDSFRILSETRVGYMDLIGSGNETSAHLLENGRVTFMFCAFEGKPNILRLYGNGKAILPESEGWKEVTSHFKIFPSTRQIIVADIDLVQTSCGFGVPLFNYQGERVMHFDWADAKGDDGLAEYINEKNLKSLDGLPTHLSNGVS